MSENLASLFAEYEKNAAITVLPKGTHRLKVASASAKNNGIQPVFTVQEGPDAGKRAMAGGIFPGTTEGGRIAFFRKLEKFGLGKDFFAKNPTLEDVAKALVGRVVDVDLDVKEWNGEDRNEMGFGIKLVDAPALPGVGGVPNTATSASAPVSSEPQVPAPVPTSAATATPVVDTDPGF